MESKEQAVERLMELARQRHSAQGRVSRLTSEAHDVMRELRDRWGLSNAEVGELAKMKKQNVFRILGPAPRSSTPIDAGAASS